VAYVVLCVRFASLVRVYSSRNRLQRSAGHATLDTGGWLDLATGTFTLLETPSFACRANVEVRGAPLTKAKRSRRTLKKNRTPKPPTGGASL